MKKILTFIFIVALFVIVGCLDTVETTAQKDITDAQIQAEINRNSK